MNQLEMSVACILAGLLTIVIATIIETFRRCARFHKICSELYFAGHWKAEGVSEHEADRMWATLRDVLGLRPGSWTLAAKLDTRK